MSKAHEYLKELLREREAEVTAYESEHGQIQEDLKVPSYLIEIDGKSHANPDYRENFQLYELHRTKFSRIPEIKDRLNEENPAITFDPNIERGIFLLKVTAPKLKSETGLGGLILDKKDIWIGPRKDRPEDIIFSKSRAMT